MIYKFILNQETYTLIKTGKVVKWLDLQWQDGNLVIWAIVDTEDECAYLIVPFWTGQSIENIPSKEVAYLGTIQQDDLVWHYFAYEVEDDGSL